MIVAGPGTSPAVKRPAVSICPPLADHSTGTDSVEPFTYETVAVKRRVSPGCRVAVSGETTKLFTFTAARGPAPADGSGDTGSGTLQAANAKAAVAVRTRKDIRGT
jgi:hypothetical protein